LLVYYNLALVMGRLCIDRPLACGQTVSTTRNRRKRKRRKS
jgi:hypothetical protein